MLDKHMFIWYNYSMKAFKDIFTDVLTMNTQVRQYLPPVFNDYLFKADNSYTELAEFIYITLLNRYANSIPIYDFVDSFVRHFTEVLCNNVISFSLRYTVEINRMSNESGDVFQDDTKIRKYDHKYNTSYSDKKKRAEGPATLNYTGDYVDDYSNSQEGYEGTKDDTANDSTTDNITLNPFTIANRLRSYESLSADIVKPFAKLFIQYGDYCYTLEDNLE